MGRLARASVHGRFQPFHNGHLDYFRQAFDQSAFVHIGITQIFHPEQLPETAAVRDTPSGNPLTYFQRTQLIEATLEFEGISQARYSFAPFPIELPTRLTEFLPATVPCFTTKLNAWNDKKIELLESLGYSVKVLKATLPDDKRVATGGNIRELIRSKNPLWKQLVPDPVVKLIVDEMIESFVL